LYTESDDKCSFRLDLHQGVAVSLADIDINVSHSISESDTVQEGTIITLSCPPGFILTGSNTSTCMDNGEWEPDPRLVECIQLGNYIIESTSISYDIVD
jgi:hypothetical protein